MVFFPAAQANLELVYEGLHKGLLSSLAEDVSLCYTRAMSMSEVQAKQLFAYDKSPNRKELVSNAIGKYLVVWVLGAQDEALLAQIKDHILLAYKDKPESLYCLTDSNAITALTKLITTEWKEKGNAFKS